MRQVRWDAWLIGLLSFAAVIGTYVIVYHLTHFTGLGAFSSYGVSALVYMLRRRVASHRLGALITSPSPVSQHPVRLELKKEGALYGDDYGIVTFIDGSLVYDGFLTSFSLSPLWAPPAQEKIDRQFGNWVASQTYHVKWQVQGARFEAVFTPQVGIPGADRNFEKKLRGDFTTWKNWTKLGGKVAAQGQDVIPPLSPQPGFVEQLRSRTVWGQRLAMLATVGLAIGCWKVGVTWAPAGVLLIILIWCVAISSSWRYRRFMGEKIPTINCNDIKLMTILKAIQFALQPRRWWVSARAPLPEA
jgi:hypothetical protein